MNRLLEAVPFLFAYAAGLLSGLIVMFVLFACGQLKRFEKKSDLILPWQS